MRVVKSSIFNTQFQELLYFIAKDSKTRAKNFRIEILEKLEKLSFMPYKNRKSIYFNDENIRDFIYKGYVVPYKIDKEQIVIIGINKYKIDL